MKKRLLSLVLCLVMVFSLFPAFGMNAAAVDVSPEGYVSLGSSMTGSQIGTWTAGSVPAGYPAAENSTLYVKIGEHYFPVTAENRGYYTQKFYANGTADGAHTYIKFKSNSDWDAFPMPSVVDGDHTNYTGQHTGYYVYYGSGEPQELMYNFIYHEGALGSHPYYEYLPYTESMNYYGGGLFNNGDNEYKVYYDNTKYLSHENWNNHVTHREANWSGWYCLQDPGYNGLKLDLYEHVTSASAYNYVYYTRNGEQIVLANDYFAEDVQPGVELFYKSNYTASSITATDADVSEVVEVEMGAPKTITLQFDGCVYDSVSIDNGNAATVSVENNVLTINPMTVGETAKITVTGTANADHFAPAPLVIDITVIPSGYEAPELVDVPNGNYADNAADNKGLFLSKELLFDETTGTYTIEMKAYATGNTVQQEGAAKPADIVLVLDQSASMTESNSTLDVSGYFPTDRINSDQLTNGNGYILDDGVKYQLQSYKDGGWSISGYRWHIYYVRNDGQTVTLIDGTRGHDYLDASETNGKALYYYGSETMSYMEALRSAVKDFVHTVADQDTAGETRVGHRIAIVGFSSRDYDWDGDEEYQNCEIFNGSASAQYDDIFEEGNHTNYANYALKSVDTAGVATLEASVNALTASGGTRSSEGLEMANRILEDRGTTADRDTIVILFTDGKPGDYGDDDSEAERAVREAYDLKNDYSADVYSIGIFRSSGGDESYIGSKYTTQLYMQGVSSMFNVKELSDLKANPPTPNTDKDYYQKITSSTTASLSDLFQNITQDVGGSSVQLKALAELRDGIDLKNFTRPNSSDIEVRTQKGVYVANDDPDFTDGQGNPRQEENHDDATDEDNYYYRNVDSNGVVTVSGFDYAYNFIGAGKQPSGNDLAANEGRQLIVRIKNLLPKRAEDPEAANPLAGQTGNVLPSNVFEPSDAVAGVYENHAAARPVAKVDVPWTKILSRPAVIDFNAKMTVATGVNKMTEEGVEKAAIDGNNGDFVKTGTNVTYQLDSDTQLSETKSATINGVYSDVDKAMAFHAKTETTDGYWEEIVAIPANCIYFDDSFDASNTTLNVDKGIGFNRDLTGATSETGEGTVSAGEYTFTFTGTGVDIYCTTSEDGKYVQAALFYADNDQVPIGRSKAMRNYSEETRYNVPTLHFAAPEWGTYKVKIDVSAHSNFRLDGIRVYNPVKDDAATQQKIYTDNGAGSEKNASFFNLRELLINGKSNVYHYGDNTPMMEADWINSLDSLMGNISSVLYVDNADGIRTVTKAEDGSLVSLYDTTFEAYEKNSPKNEIYLSQGQGIAFTVTNYQQLVGDGAHFYIGLSTGSQTDASVWFQNLTGDDVPDEAHQATVKSAVDMYYPIVPAAGSTFVIVNKSTANIAVTDLKICGSSNKLTLPADKPSGAQVLSVTEAEELDVTDLTELKLEVNQETQRVLANYKLEELDPVVDPQNPDEPDTPDEPQTPSFMELVKQLLSDFVSRMFGSISRLFGN